MSKDQPSVIRRLDEVVVNRIAAGEVIQRPANALKEMLENSLDAKSSQITVTVRGGGLKLLQIGDNGTGIRKEDMEIVAERFTTSKLSTFEDLGKIATYGFRGEALASISHVARLSIQTKTRDSQCGFKAEYSDGKLLSTPKACAANQGTTITVEELFYNVPTRKNALRSTAEEHNKIADVVSRYSIHNATVGFTLKKQGESSVDVKTPPRSTVLDNIQIIYGGRIAKELLEFDKTDENLKFSAKGYISNVNYSVKKMVFLLFINHRLVDSSALRKTLESVYSTYLPKGMSPFVYLSLEIAPQNVDVNVHPTKHEVFFLHQDSIIEKIGQAVEHKLLNSNVSRTFYAQTLLPGAGTSDLKVQIFGEKSDNAAVAAKDMIRTDSREQKLDKFLTKNVEMESLETDPDKSEDGASRNKKIKLSTSDDEVESMDLDEPATPNKRCKLDSVNSLRSIILKKGSSTLKDIIHHHIFVGCVNRKFALVQHSTKLYLINTIKLSNHFFYQSLISNFGEHGVLRLSPPPPVRSLVLLGLEVPEVGWSEGDGSKEQLADTVVETLLSRKDMLQDYFSMELEVGGDGELMLTGLPLLLQDYTPWLAGIPVYLIKLATEVNWKDEQSCFDSFCKETANFYAVRENGRFDSGQHNNGDDEKWKYTLEHVLYPAMKKSLLPPEICGQDMTILQIANLPDLYKVFERC